MSAAERKFWARVNRGSDIECWLWTAGQRSTGYGSFHNGEKNVSAHRFAYEMQVGPIPHGMVLDHLCRTRLCVNPSHLEPITNAENVLRGVGHTAINARKSHCNKGHEYTPSNTYTRPGGGRTCITCRREWDRQRRAA